MQLLETGGGDPEQVCLM